jgi:ethanolamine ammonia-lyase large subunit
MHVVEIDGTRYAFADLRDLMAKASPPRSGDRLAGIAAQSAAERVAAQMALALPGGDDIMLNYQSTSYHDVLAMREVLGLAPAPEFADWLARMGLMTETGRIGPQALPSRFLPLIA